MYPLYTEESLKEGQILVFDKPYGWTSFYLVNKVRYMLCRHVGIKKLKVGHAGTLDPLATGLLVLCTGKATKRISEIQNTDKEYIADITFGKTTPSYDLETDFNGVFEYEHINRQLLLNILEEFLGKIMQRPPLFSAKNINGVRAYKHAREGKTTQLDEVEIEIHEIELIKFELPEIRLKIICSKGTYIRSLANDIGIKLNSGAYLSGLKRTAVGRYNIGSALSIENFKKNLNIL